MKRLLSAALLLLTLGVVAVFLWQMQHALPERARGAELAPAETVFFAQLPNLRQTAQRFPQTGLARIWNDPEVQAFLEKPRQTAPQFREWEQQFGRLARLAPGEAFVAVVSLDGARPQFVAGLSFAGRKAEAEAFLSELRQQWMRHFPVGKSTVTSYKDNEIETFPEVQGGLSECLRENWFFFADDLPLLKATLDRCASPAGSTAGTLAGQETFQKATAPLGPGLDSLLFAQLTPLSQRVGSLIAAAGPSAAGLKIDRSPETQALASGTRLEGAQLRDLVFFLDPGHPAAPPLTRHTLALAAPETLLYYAARLPKSLPAPDAGGLLHRFLPDLSALDPQLAARGLQWSELGNAVGPELGTVVTWPEDAATPAVLLAVEVQDRTRARAFLDAFQASNLGLVWQQTEQDGVTYYRSPVAAFSLLQPTLALTDRFLLLGLNPRVVAAGLQQLHSEGGGLAQSPGYLQVESKVTAPTSGFGYLDSGRLFDRAYGMLRPFAIMSLAFSGETSTVFDAGKLPSADAVSRHLSPSVFSQSTTPEGTLLESTGTLTFNQLLLGLAGGTAAATLPSLQKLFPGAAPTPSPAATPVLVP